MDMIITEDTLCFGIAYCCELCSLYPHELYKEYEALKPKRRRSIVIGLYLSLKYLFLKVICIEVGKCQILCKPMHFVYLLLDLEPSYFVHCAYR